jgi:hypothetical protein
MTYFPRNPNGIADSSASQPVVLAKDQVPGAYNKIVDEASSTVMYIGIAACGVLSNASFWQIKKVEVVGSETIITWAGGNSDFDKIWDNRAALTYS